MYSVFPTPGSPPTITVQWARIAFSINASISSVQYSSEINLSLLILLIAGVFLILILIPVFVTESCSMDILKFSVYASNKGFF